jgi:3-hydroxybutyryl-CoA dehydrogenase
MGTANSINSSVDQYIAGSINRAADANGSMDVAVLGADEPGWPIASVCALSGHSVSLCDEDPTDAMDALDDIERHLDGAVEAGQREPAAREDALGRLEATTGLGGAVADADVVVEAATGDPQSLQNRFADIEELADRETLIASGLAGVSLTAAAAGLRYPDRAVGLQFRDPLDRPLVEVVVADQTSEENCDRASGFVRGLDFSPVVVRDAPGVVSTRTVLALEAEAMRLVGTGVASVTAADDALALGYGHPIGPLEQADRAGLDDRLEALAYLHDELGERFEPPTVLRERVAAGHTGLASGEGFYVWENGEPSESALRDPEIPRRDRGPDDLTSG